MAELDAFVDVVDGAQPEAGFEDRRHAFIPARKGLSAVPQTSAGSGIRARVTPPRRGSADARV